MKNELTRFPFIFFPDKLSNQCQELQTLFGEVEYQLHDPQSDHLSFLLERIRKTPNSQLDHLSQQFNQMELDLITRPIPFENRNESMLVQKITHILTKRYTPEIGQQVWKYYQNNPEHKEVLPLLRYAFQIQDLELRFDDYEKKSWKILSQAMNQNDPIHDLANRLVQAKQPLKILSAWRVQPESLLEQTLLYTMIQIGLANDSWIKHNNREKWLIQQIKLLSMNQLKSLIQVYVQSRKADTFYAKELMNFFRNQLGDPQRKKENWKFLGVQALEEVRQYYMKSQIKKFFAKDHNSHRFQFWEKYLDKVTIYELHKKPSVLFLYFSEFVVVEFAGKGNAAYIYHPQGFDQIVLPRYKKAPQTKKAFCLKELTAYSAEGIPVYINRISHKGSWKKRMSEIIEGYLEGRFEKG